MLLKHLEPGELLLGDKYFAKREILGDVRQQGADFLMRVREGDFMGPAYPRTNLENPNEWLTTLKVSKKLRKQRPDLPEELPVRILRYQIPGFRSSFLITSLLDDKEYPYEELVALSASGA